MVREGRERGGGDVERADRERTQLDAHLAARRLQCIPVAADGLCQFRALTHGTPWDLVKLFGP